MVDIAIEGTGFLKEQALLAGKLLGLLSGDDSAGEVSLVANQYDLHVGIAEFADVLEPGPDVPEGLVLGDVVDDDGAVGVAVVTSS